MQDCHAKTRQMSRFADEYFTRTISPSQLRSISALVEKSHRKLALVNVCYVKRIVLQVL